MQTDHGLHELI